MRPLVIAMAAAAIVAALRGLPFLLWPHAAFDSDQAVVGLMAKHLMEGRALPLFFYGQPYMLAVQAWLAAPLFAIGGVSIALLKLPLVAINAAAAALLVCILARDAQVSPLRAFAAAVFFIAAPPVAGVQMVAAMGGSVEPFLYVLLIWVLRDRPILCGVVAGVAFLHREFSAYGLAALFITISVYRAREWRLLLPRWLLLGAMFLLVLEIGRLGRPFGDMFGPEMPKLQGVSAISNLEAVAARVECPNGLEISQNVQWLLRINLPTLVGTSGNAENEYFAGPATRPSPWIWTVFCLGVLAASLRLVQLRWIYRLSIPAVTVFLLLVGLQAVVVYVSRCGVRDPMLVRYTLLGLLIPVALGTAFLRLEPVRVLRGLALVLLAAWMGWSARSYIRIVSHYWQSPPVSRHALMAAELERRNIRYGYAGYWDAHHINFLTAERVVLAPIPRSRIYTYDAVVWRAPDKVYVQSTPCQGELIGSLWLCSDTPASPRSEEKRSIEIVFPPTDESQQFRQALEAKYQTTLKRASTRTMVDTGPALSWTQEYIRYRLSGCDHTPAVLRVFMAVDGRGAQPACEPLGRAATIFPPREELVAFRRELESKYASRSAPVATFVDIEGEVIWTSEYLRYRIAGCGHRRAVERVMQQIDGGSAPPGC